MNRRSLLKSAASACVAGSLSPLEAQHVHHQAAAAKPAAGAYQPKLFTPHEWKTVQVLADLIIPPEGSVPGGAGAGAPEFIDLLAANNARLKEIWQGGLAWLDAAMRKQAGVSFALASAAEQRKLLDLIAYRKNDSPETGPGIRFFDWARRMVVDAWTTSPTGVQVLGYQGNKGMREFEIPAEALDYALRRSPFRQA